MIDGEVLMQLIEKMIRLCFNSVILEGVKWISIPNLHGKQATLERKFEYSVFVWIFVFIHYTAQNLTVWE